MQSLLVTVFTDTELVIVFFSVLRKIAVPAKLMFISLVLFQFACFALSVEAFNQFTPKGQCMYSGQQHLV